MSSLVVGVASAVPTHTAVLIAAVAGLVAGAFSMTAGEYVSVSSLSDTEQADLSRERVELATSPKAVHAELADIYVARGLSRDLAIHVAEQLMSPTVGDVRLSTGATAHASAYGDAWPIQVPCW